MDNQHRKISGYRELSQQEIDLINEIKQKGVDLGVLCDRLNQHLLDKFSPVALENDPELRSLMAHSDPFSWLANGKGSLQTALMMITRAVAQPITF